MEKRKSCMLIEVAEAKMSRKQTQMVWDKDLHICPFLSECFYSGKQSRRTGRRHLVWFVWLCLACGPCVVGCSQTAHLKDSRSYWSQHPQKPGAHLKKEAFLRDLSFLPSDRRRKAEIMLVQDSQYSQKCGNMQISPHPLSHLDFYLKFSNSYPCLNLELCLFSGKCCGKSKGRAQTEVIYSDSPGS